MVTNGSPAIERGELEKQKMQAEIEEIRLRIEQGKKNLDFERTEASRQNLRSWIAIVISLVTIAGGAVTIGVQINSFFMQSVQKQTADITQEMITLVNNLTVTDDLTVTGDIKRGNAALLLSVYEMEAVPILLNNLEIAINPDPITESLRLIKKRLGRKEKQLRSALEDRAGDVFSRCLKGLPTLNYTITPDQEKAEKRLSNFITALQRLYGDDPDIEKLFDGWRSAIESRQPPVAKINREALMKLLERKKR